MHAELECSGWNVRERQPCSGQAAGGVKRPSGKGWRCAPPHFPHTNSISTTSGAGAVARTTVPRIVTSFPTASALMAEMGRRASGWLRRRGSTLQACCRPGRRARVSRSRSRYSACGQQCEARLGEQLARWRCTLAAARPAVAAGEAAGRPAAPAHLGQHPPRTRRRRCRPARRRARAPAPLSGLAPPLPPALDSQAGPGCGRARAPRRPPALASQHPQSGMPGLRPALRACHRLRTHRPQSRAPSRRGAAPPAAAAPASGARPAPSNDGRRRRRRQEGRGAWAQLFGPCPAPWGCWFRPEGWEDAAWRELLVAAEVHCALVGANRVGDVP